MKICKIKKNREYTARHTNLRNHEYTPEKLDSEKNHIEETINDINLPDGENKEFFIRETYPNLRNHEYSPEKLDSEKNPIEETINEINLPIK